MTYSLEDDGRLVFTGFNQAASDILGVDCSQYIGKTIEEAFPPLAETEVPDRYRQACLEGIPWQKRNKLTILDSSDWGIEDTRWRRLSF